MSVELCCNPHAIKVIRWCDTPHYILNDYSVCLNCIHWYNINGVEGRCDCEGEFADNKGLYTFYDESCCYCFLRSKWEYDYDAKERLKLICKI